MQNTDQLFGDDVIDNGGNKVGTVDGVWVDDATDQLAFIAVKTGWLFGKNHLMPVEQGQIQNTTIQVPYSADQIKNGPSFATDAELSADDEQQIYSYYGVQRSTQTSPTGYASGNQSQTAATGSAWNDQTQQTTDPTSQVGQGDLPTPPDEVDVTTAQEELAVGKRVVQAGGVRLRKVVRTETQEVPVELRREDIEIERIPADQLQGGQVPDDAFQEGTIDVPVMEEQPVVSKQTVATGGVRLSKTVETQTQTVSDQVRSTDVEIDGDDDVTDSTSHTPASSS